MPKIYPYNQYQPRIYRNRIASDDLVNFRVAIDETDVFISACQDLSEEAVDIIIGLRSDIKKYIQANNIFATSLKPVLCGKDAPAVIKNMVKASWHCGVGPMASVAGAVAETAGKRLLRLSCQVIVENGGDIFMLSSKSRTIGIYAGPASAFKDKLVIRIEPEDTPCGICTSSATVGHSLSFGKADAVVVVSPSASLADACATALCNKVKSEKDIGSVIRYGKSLKGITGILIVINDKLGAWGNIRLAH
ncbi:MAG: UPF0280 family protein [Candidatus Omnitrophica bacterium]|nr:UPF0280 family protein [Candidatus Omnitrophota bacterium]